MLEKKVVPIPLTSGPDGKSDPRLSPLTQASVVDNIVFDDQETPIIRGGQTKITLPTGMGVSGSIVHGHVHRDTPIAELTDGSVWALEKSGLPAGAKYGSNDVDAFNPQSYLRVSADERRLVGFRRKTTTYPFQDMNFDVAESATSGTYCLAYDYCDTAQGFFAVRVSIRDTASDKELLGYVVPYAVGKTYCKPRVIYSLQNDRYVVLFARFNNGSTTWTLDGIYTAASGAGAVTSVATIMTLAGTATVEAALSQEALFDVSAFTYSGGSARACLVARKTTAAGDLSLTQMNDDCSLVGGSGAAIVPSAYSYCLAAHITQNAGVWTSYVVYASSVNTKVFGHSVTSAGVDGGEITVADNALPFSPVTGISRLSMLDDPLTAGRLLVVAVTRYTSVAGGSIDDKVYVISVDSALANRASATFNQSNSGLTLAARPFVVNSRIYIPLVILSQSYNSVLLVWDATPALAAKAAGTGTLMSPHMIARLGYGEAWAPSQANSGLLAQRLPASLSSGLVYLKRETDLLLAGSTDDTGMCLARADFSFSAQLGSVEYNSLTLLAGACPLVNDGVRIVEESFHFPPDVSAAYPNGNGRYVYGVLPAGTYSFCFTEAWMDGAGNWWESAPSLPVSVTSTGIAVSFDIARAPSLKPSGERRLLMYRTLVSPSTNTNFYLGLTAAGAVVVDASLPGGQVLATAETPQAPCPPCHHFAAFQTRLVASGGSNRVFWSKKFDRGFMAEFCTGAVAFERAMPSQFGRVTGTAEMDSKLILLGENCIGAMFGGGPDNFGNGEFSDVETLIWNTGALYTAPRAIGLSPEGVWFQSLKGPRCFTRGGTLGGHGQEVDSLVTGNLIFVAGGQKEQVWFADTGSGNQAFIWDFRFGRFSRFSNWRNTETLYASGKFYRLVSNPFVTYYNESTLGDIDNSGNAGVINATFETNWIQLAGIQGFQRAYRLAVFGATDTVPTPGSQTIVVFAEYDYSSVFPSSVEFDGTGILASDGDKLFQFRHHLSKQKCEAVRFRIIWSASGGTARMRLTALSLEVGVKAGIFKMAQT